MKAFKIHEDGKEYITDILSDGDFIGYHALINDSNYADSTLILEEAEIMQIPREDFLQMIYKDIQVAAKFTHIRYWARAYWRCTARWIVQGEVAHLIAGHLRVLTPLLGNLVTDSRDFH